MSIDKGNIVAIEKTKEDDINEIASIHIRTFKEKSMGAYLGKEFIAEKIRWFVCNSNSISLIAFIDNKVVGFVYGAALGYSSIMHRYLIKRYLEILLKKPYIILNSKLLSALINKILKLKNDNENAVNMDYYPTPVIKLADVAVIDDYKNQGIGGKLVNAFEREASKRGYKCIILKTKKNNTAAIKMYKKNNWVNIDDVSSKAMAYFIKLI